MVDTRLWLVDGKDPIRMHHQKTFQVWLFLLGFGTLYSIWTIGKNIGKYISSPTSIRTETKWVLISVLGPYWGFRLQHQLHMLNVYVCLNSQHSRWRLRALFNSTHGLEENISIFYGNYFNSNKDVTLTHFNYIDLDDFFAHTAPELVVLRVSYSLLWVFTSICTSGFELESRFFVFSVDLIWRSVHKQNEGWPDMAIATITISGAV